MKTDTIASASTIIFNPRFGKKKEANLCYLLLFPLKYGDIECGVTWAEGTAGAHRLVAHRRAGWVFSRVTSGRLFLRTKTAEPGDAHNVSLRSQVLLCASPASLWSGIRGASRSPHTANSLQVRDYTIAETRLYSQRETERDWNCMSRERAVRFGCWERKSCCERSLREIQHPTDTGITFKAV